MKPFSWIQHSSMHAYLLCLVLPFIVIFILLPSVSSWKPADNAKLANMNLKTSHDEVDILPLVYDRDVAPVNQGKPVEVEVSVVVLNMKLTTGSTQYFDADIFYHNRWDDYRLQKPADLDNSIAQRNKSLPVHKLNQSWRNKLWIPDTYFRNAASGSVSNILTPTHYFTVRNYTNIFMAVRIQLKLTCDMYFNKYPFDTQKCFINITTTSEDTKTMMLKWKMFRVGSHVDLSEFSIISTNQNECVKKMDIGAYSCLYAEIVFKRNLGNYLIKKFIPSFVIVLTTFVGFWIPATISPARTALPVTSLLALITQQIQSDLNVSYVYALQIWNIVCIMFVFASLVEFSFALYVMDLAQKAKSKREERLNSVHKLNQKRMSDIMMTQLEVCENNKSVDTDSQASWRRYWRPLRAKLYAHIRTSERHSAVDMVARYLFPLAFFLFTTLFAVKFCYCT